MAHELGVYDNMFSASGITPWHGIGIVLDSPPTIEEGLQKANLDWGVRLLPLYCQIPPDLEFHTVSNRAVLREDTNEILGTVGANYTPLQNRDAFNLFAPLVEDRSILLETAGSIRNGRRVWILARINTDSADISKGDEIKPYILLSNSHDGTLAVRFGFTHIRVVCNNTLSAAIFGKVSKLIRLTHTANIYNNLETLRGVLDLAKASFVASIEQYRSLASKDINVADLERYVKVVLDPDFKKEFDKAQENDEDIDITLTRTQSLIIDIFERGIGSDLPKARTWWGAYNSVNEWLMYHKGRNIDNRLNSVWFGDGYNTNNRALEVAMKMAA